jgi:hypothetical protein
LTVTWLATIWNICFVVIYRDSYCLLKLIFSILMHSHRYIATLAYTKFPYKPNIKIIVSSIPSRYLVLITFKNGYILKYIRKPQGNPPTILENMRALNHSLHMPVMKQIQKILWCEYNEISLCIIIFPLLRCRRWQPLFSRTRNRWHQWYS